MTYGKLFKNIDDLWANYAFERDAREFSLGDTLDIKTSIILVVLVFLAGQTDTFFHDGLVGDARILQYVSVGAVICGGICAVFELIPRRYSVEATPTEYDTWIADLKKRHEKDANPDAVVLERAILGRAKRAKERAETNIAVNERKSNLMTASFYFSAASLGANLITMVMRLF